MLWLKERYYWAWTLNLLGPGLLISPMLCLGWQYQARGCSLPGLISSIGDLCFLFDSWCCWLANDELHWKNIPCKLKSWNLDLFFFCRKIEETTPFTVQCHKLFLFLKGDCRMRGQVSKAIISRFTIFTPSIGPWPWPRRYSIPFISSFLLILILWTFSNPNITFLLLTTISFDDSSYQFELLNHSQIWFKSFRTLSYSLILYIWSTSVYNICIQLCHIFLLVDLNVAYSWLEDMGWCYSMSGVACLIHEH